MKKIINIGILLIVLTLFITACSSPKAEEEKNVVGNNDIEESNDIVNVKNLDIEQLKEPKEDDIKASMVTDYGTIKIRLFKDVAPKTVENFVTHAKKGYYNGLTFHRVIDGFMIQGGDPTGTGAGGESIWSEPFEDEFNVDYHNFRGALSMANAGPNTNGSQFFIVQGKEFPEELLEQMELNGEEGGYSKEVIKAYKQIGGTPWLDYGHTVFGQVYEGMDVVDEIVKQKVDGKYKPLEDITIQEIIIE